VLSGGLAIDARTRKAFAPLAVAELWDPATNAWAPLPDPPSERAYGVLVATERGAFRVSGSGDGERAFRSIERLLLD
ncbi:MAG: hypothetical protein ACRDM7_17510, partial [Thermoleophilaceae bacterium]